MRTAAREAAPQIALRDCSREARGKVIICVILVKGEFAQSSTHFFAEGVLLVTRNSHHYEGF